VAVARCRPPAGSCKGASRAKNETVGDASSVLAARRRASPAPRRGANLAASTPKPQNFLYLSLSDTIDAPRAPPRIRDGVAPAEGSGSAARPSMSSCRLSILLLAMPPTLRALSPHEMRSEHSGQGIGRHRVAPTCHTAAQRRRNEPNERNHAAERPTKI